MAAAASGPPTTKPLCPPSWTSGQRIAFRFGVIYFTSYSLLNGNVATLPLALIARNGKAPDWYANSTNLVWSAVGRTFGVHGPIRAFDNGDGVGDHVQLLCFVLVAVIGTIGWSLLDRRHVDYRRGLKDRTANADKRR